MVLKISDLFNEKISMIKSVNAIIINILNIILNNQNYIIKSITSHINNLNICASITSKNIIDKISTSIGDKL